VTAASVAVVVGNPRVGSRTGAVATAVADRVAAEVGWDPVELVVVELGGLGPRLFDGSDREVTAAVARVAGCRLVVVASPTYKATYTGLLKSFLDWYGTTGLAGVVAIPVMVGAGPRHALAVEVHLRPVLVEIGASMPSRGLYVLEEEFGDLDRVLDEWWSDAAAPLRASLSASKV